MKSSDAPHIPTNEGHENPGRTANAVGAGKLSGAESILYTGARGIEHTIDAIRDRPLIALAIAAAVLALVALIPGR